jgi:hypothetical protein
LRFKVVVVGFDTTNRQDVKQMRPVANMEATGHL